MPQITIRLAVPLDLPFILPIYAHARTLMKATGNKTQWGNQFPPRTLLAQDIKQKQLYVLERQNRIYGVFAFIIGCDDTYQTIDGAWLSDETYGTLHRVASDGTVTGIFNAIVSFCEQQITHLRIDTHKDNRIMRHLIEKNDFRFCGVIHVADGTPRLAYEKV